jgi:hypothetical protein
MPAQSCTTVLDGFVVLAGPPKLLRELRERNRRRIGVDPAPELGDAWALLRHGAIVEPSEAKR